MENVENTLVRKKPSKSFHTQNDKSSKQEKSPNFGKDKLPHNDQKNKIPVLNNIIDRNKPIAQNTTFKAYGIPSNNNNNNNQNKLMYNHINKNMGDIQEIMNKQSPKNENNFAMKIYPNNLNPIKPKTATEIPNKGDFDNKPKQNSTQNDSIKKRLSENEFIKNNQKSLDLVKNCEMSAKEMMKVLGYFQFLEELKKKLVDSNETKSLKEENTTLKEIIENYEIKIKKIGEENEKLREDYLDMKSKLTESRGRETKLNNDLKKAQSKSPISRNSKKDYGE